MGTDWSLVEGFDINYITVFFMSEQTQSAIGYFCFYRVGRKNVQGIALRENETN